jgi:hypothetical protein
MKTILLLSLTVSLFVACSSSYSPDEKMLAFKKNMSSATAVEFLQERIWEDKNTAGICGSRGFWYDEESAMKVTADKVSLLAHRRGRQLKKQSQSFGSVVVFEKQYYYYDFIFSNINKIIIYDDPRLLAVFPSCNLKDINKKYFIIDLFTDKLLNLKFIVQANDFSQTMAALSILIPEKPVIIK